LTILFLLTLFSSLAEILSLGMFIPIFEYISDIQNNESTDSKISRYIKYFFDFFDIKYSLLFILIFSFILFFLARMLVFLTNYLTMNFEIATIKRLRDDMIVKYLSAESEYHDKLNSGEFINITLVQLKRAVGRIFFYIKLFVFITTAIFSIFVLLFLSYQLTIFSFIAILLPILIASRWVNASRTIGIKHANSESFIGNYLISRLHAAKLVFLSGSLLKESATYKKLTNITKKFSFQNQVLKLKTNTFLEIASLGIVLFISYLAIIYIKTSVQVMILYLIISVRLIPIIKNIMNTIQSIKASKGAIDLVDKFFDNIQPYLIDIHNIDFKKNKNEEIKTLEFKKVLYSYNKNVPAIENISFKISRPSLNILIGPSGSGKSTILDILSTFRKPKSGEYLINNTKYDNEIQKIIISQISYLPQDSVFFEKNLFDHITYNSKNFDKKLFQDAIKYSGVSEFIDADTDFKEIYFEENAANFSGGQRQRIELARIFYENKSIVILDEPTNKLDYYQENEFIKILINYVHHKKSIVLIITHKFELAKNADQVIILDKGRLIDAGNHKYLYQKNEWYSKKFTN